MEDHVGGAGLNVMGIAYVPIHWPEPSAVDPASLQGMLGNVIFWGTWEEGKVSGRRMSL